MTKEEYDVLLHKIRSEFSPKVGVVVQLRSKKKRKPLSLCVSGMHNDGEFVPRFCYLWDGPKLLYDGDMNKLKLRNILTKHDICCAEITCAADLDLNKEGEYICFGDLENCKCKMCKCTANEFWTRLKKENKELQYDPVVIRQRKLEKLIKTAWKKGREDVICIEPI